MNDGKEAVHSFTNSGMFTLYTPATVRILVVGGGGGGGGDCAPGGGGGGVIDTNDVALAAGRYAVTVGGGGLLGSTTGIKGSNGGDSVVTLVASDGTETELYRAYGGGGGGAWNNGAGRDGGCGGGGWSNPGHGVAGQGYDAVADSGPGAGGGAGGSPVAANVGRGNSTQHQADGGPGRASDITGTTEYYGPGGGSGGFDGWGGLGGDQTTLATEGWIWGCGWSHSSAQSDAAMTAEGRRQEGRDGYGGGGGGSSNSHYAGGNGGSGCVIFRLSNELTDPNPTLAVPSIDPSWFSVSFPVQVSFAGAGATADEVSLSLQFSADAADFGADGAFAGTETVLDAHFLGARTFSVSDLKPAHAYYLRLVARNDAGGVTVSDRFAVTTLAQNEVQWIAPSGEAVADGLRMYRYDSASFADWDEAADWLVMPETFSAALSSGGGSGLYGLVYVAADGTQWRFPSGVSDWYDTWMWMEAGRQYNFFCGKFADNLRFYLDGELFHRQQSYNSAAVFSTTPDATGWRHVRIWFGGSTGNCGAWDGFLYGFGWNVDGATAVAGKPGTGDWSMLSLDSGARLKTFCPGRDVAVAGYAPDGDDLDFTVAAGAGAPGTLLAVWGGAYPAAPEDTNAWANVATVGAVSAAAQTASFAVPASASYVRFALVQEDGTVCWSPTSQIDLSAVSLVDLGVAADGDTGTFSVRVGSVGTGTFSLALEIADNAAMAGARTIAIDAAAPGDYTVSTNVAAGATSYYRFVGTTTDGGRDETAVASFTTLAGNTGLAASPSVSVNNHTVTVTFPDFAYGAGTPQWTVLAGDDAGSLEARTAFTVNPRTTGGCEIVIPFPEWTRTWRLKIVSGNVAPGGTEWTSETSLFSATTVDSVEYTWKASVADGDWTDAENWTFSSADRLCNGFPSNANCSVKFPANAEATIRIPAGLYPVNKFHPSAQDSTIALVGAGRGETALGKANNGSLDAYGIVRRETFELRALTFREQDGFDGGIGQYNDCESTNAVVRVADGSYVALANNEQKVRGVGAAIRVEGGSELRIANVLKLNGAGDVLVVDDSLVTVGSVNVEDTVSLGPQTVRFRGQGAKVADRDGVFADTTGHAMANDFTLLFELPSGGYTNGPALFSSASGGNALPLGTIRNAASTGKFLVAADAAAMRSGPGAECFLVGWKAGIDANGVELVPGDGYELRFAYGWDAESNLPAGLDEPENEGDLPTGVFCSAPARTGTLIVVR